MILFFCFFVLSKKVLNFHSTAFCNPLAVYDIIVCFLFKFKIFRYPRMLLEI